MELQKLNETVGECKPKHYFHKTTNMNKAR